MGRKGCAPELDVSDVQRARGKQFRRKLARRRVPPISPFPCVCVRVYACPFQVSSVLADEGSTMAEIAQAFQVVETEIFKLLAYDPFPRFKRRDETINNVVV